MIYFEHKQTTDLTLAIMIGFTDGRSSYDAYLANANEQMQQHYPIGVGGQRSSNVGLMETYTFHYSGSFDSLSYFNRIADSKAFRVVRIDE